MPFSTVAAQIYNPINSVQGFPFLHILSNICNLWSFLMIAILISMRWYLIEFCIFLMISYLVLDSLIICMGKYYFGLNFWGYLLALWTWISKLGKICHYLNKLFFYYFSPLGLNDTGTIKGNTIYKSYRLPSFLGKHCRRSLWLQGFSFSWLDNFNVSSSLLLFKSALTFPGIINHCILQLQNMFGPFFILPL